MYSGTDWIDLPFQQAIDYIRGKVNLPTQKWDDIKGEMHVRAFVVAGAMESSLLCDLHEAVTKAIEKGTTLEEFRKDFREAVSRSGWEYYGSESWRSALIYDTNLRTAFAAGRWQQIEETADVFPYVVYRTMDDGRERPQHKKWHGVIVRVGSDWLLVYYPPNGWGCRCYVEQLTEEEALALLGEEGYSDKAPEPEYVEQTSPRTGEITKVVPGIDTGWDYNVGVSAFGSRLHQIEMAKGAKGWTPLLDTTYSAFERPAKLPLNKTDIRPLKEAMKTQAEVEEYLKSVYGTEKLFSFQQGDFTHSIAINSEIMSRHFSAADLSRSRYLPYLEDLVSKPYEVWVAFEKSNKDQKVALRYRYVKAYDLGKGKGMLAVIEAHNGFMTGWTFFPTSDLKYLNKQRYGHLIFGE